ncbi:hypothetical protein ACVFYP_01005 [Roseomonas sp. F4]
MRARILDLIRGAKGLTALIRQIAVRNARGAALDLPMLAQHGSGFENRRRNPRNGPIDENDRSHPSIAFRLVARRA